MKKFFYRVSDGETIIGVAKKFSVPVVTLIELNALTSEISEGDLLYVETEERTLYMVKPFETAESIGGKFGVLPEKILSDNKVPYLFYGLIIVI